MIPLITNPFYSYTFSHKHRFPMEKFALLNAHLKDRNILSTKNTFRPGRAKKEILELAHCPEYLDRFINNKQSDKEIRRMGLPWTEPLVKRSLISPNGTLLTASLALDHGIACHLAGGTHHAHRDFASGFCILNDLAIAALALVNIGSIDRILIFDCDVHQGDGTATILSKEKKIFTCSIHCEKNFPARKAKSDLDIELPKAMTDEAYLEIVGQTLSTVLKDFKPDLVIYDAGVDIYEKDPLGLLSISEKGIRKRDQLVLSMCRDQNTPIATVIGGGYDDDRMALAKRHAIVIEEANALFRDA